MKTNKIENFISQLKELTNDAVKIDHNLTIEDNNFLAEIAESENFKNLTLKKFGRPFDDYSKNDNKKQVIINNVKNLFQNGWDGAYSELTAYDFLNLVFYNK